MTTFDIVVPLIALSIAAGGILWAHLAGKRLDRDLARKRGKPAE